MAFRHTDHRHRKEGKWEERTEGKKGGKGKEQGREYKK